MICQRAEGVTIAAEKACLLSDGRVAVSFSLLEVATRPSPLFRLSSSLPLPPGFH